MVDLALAIGAVAVALTIAVALQVLFMRARAARRARRHEAVTETWRPLLFEHAVGGSAAALPPLEREDEDTVLLLWNGLQDTLHADARAGLNGLAERIGAHGLARGRLSRGDAVGRLLALRTLGHLSRPDDYDAVVPCLDDPRPYQCLAAARALVQLDPRRAPDDLLPRLAARQDWPVPLFASVLAESDPVRRSARLQAILRDASPEGRLRLLPLVPILDRGVARELLGRLLTGASDPELLAAALKQVRDPALLPYVRRACDHASWAVRTQAAAVLGRLGERVDRDRLVAMLGDSQWWVRYRAAQGLASGRFGTALEVTDLAGRLEDRFALDILEHTLAERGQELPPARGQQAATERRP